MRNNRADTQLYRKYIAQLANAYRTRSDVRMFTELLLTISAIVIFVVFAIRPTLVTIGGLTTEIGSKQETVQTMDTKIDNIVSAQQVFANESTRLTLLETGVPRQPDLDVYVNQLELIAKAHNLELFTLNSAGVPVIDTTGDGTERSMIASYTFTGEYADLIAGLSDVENLRRPIQLSDSSISLDESDGTARLFVSVKGAIPYFPIQQQQ